MTTNQKVAGSSPAERAPNLPAYGGFFVAVSRRFDEERLIYYTGPAANTERLAEELERQSDEIFAAAVERLRQKLSEALS